MATIYHPYPAFSLKVSCVPNFEPDTLGRKGNLTVCFVLMHKTPGGKMEQFAEVRIYETPTRAYSTYCETGKVHLRDSATCATNTGSNGRNKSVIEAIEKCGYTFGSDQFIYESEALLAIAAYHNLKSPFVVNTYA